jgi:hypothetical protein
MSNTTTHRRRTLDGDEALLDIERRLTELRQKDADSRVAADDDHHPDLSDAICDLETLICKTAPGGLIGVAVKLRQLVADLAAGAVGDGDEECASQVLAVIERVILHSRADARSIGPVIGGETVAAPPKPFGLPANPDRDPFLAFTSHARLLRGLLEVSIAREEAKEYGVDVSAHQEPPSREEIGKRYVELMGEWVDEEPRSAGGCLAYVELATSILFQEMRDDLDGEGVSPMGTFDDLAFVARLLASTSRWLNRLDLKDWRAAARSERAGGPA